jgi:hypothetical protein
MCTLIFEAERSLAPKTAAVLTSFDADNRRVAHACAVLAVGTWFPPWASPRP